MPILGDSAKSAAAESCRQPAGRFVPVIDRNRCEGKEDCIAACPCDVFEMRTLGAEDKKAMPVWSRLKAAVHGNRQAFLLRPESCEACGLCLTACPERAITLKRTGAL